MQTRRKKEIIDGLTAMCNLPPSHFKNSTTGGFLLQPVEVALEVGMNLCNLVLLPVTPSSTFQITSDFVKIDLFTNNCTTYNFNLCSHSYGTNERECLLGCYLDNHDVIAVDVTME
jgi:hypothetical protein